MKPNLYEQMFETLQSEDFGRTFWLDKQGDLCSAPTFQNGDADYDQWDYVSDWTELEEIVDLGKLFDIHRHLVQNQVKNQLETV